MKTHQRHGRSGSGAGSWATRRTVTIVAAAVVTTMTLVPSAPSWAIGGPTVIDLGTLPGDTVSAAMAINDEGTVIGDSQGASGAVHAVRWNSRGAILELPTTPG